MARKAKAIAAPAKTERLFHYAGLRYYGEGWHMVLTEKGKDAGTYPVDGPNATKGAIIGMAYLLEGGEGSVGVPQNSMGWQLRRQRGDGVTDDKRAEWEAEEKSSRLLWTAEKINATEHMDAILKRLAYYRYRMGSAQATAFDVYVLNYLRKEGSR